PAQGSILVRSASSAADRISRNLFDAARRNVDDLVQHINLISFRESVLVCCHHTCGALENDHQLGSVSQRLVMDERIRGHIGLALPIWIEIEHYELYGLKSVRHLEILPFLSGAHEISFSGGYGCRILPNYAPKFYEFKRVSVHAGQQGLARWHRDAASVLDTVFLPAEVALLRTKSSRLVQARRGRPVQGMRTPVCERPLRVRSG